MLGSVVQVAFEPLALGIRGLDDTAARTPQLLEASTKIGLQPFVLERDPRRPEYLFTVRGVGYRFRDGEN